MTSTPASNETDPCARPGCACATRDAWTRYCSAYCANVGGGEEAAGPSACACGHRSCLNAQAQGNPPIPQAKRSGPPPDDDVRTSIGPGPGRLPRSS